MTAQADEQIVTFVALVAGRFVSAIAAAIVLVALAALAIRGHGLRETRHLLALDWRVPVFGWLGVIAFPAIGVWAAVRDGFDVLAAIILALLWLLCVWLLFVHRRAKARQGAGRATR